MKTFFIAGAQRSGTTLLSVLLSKHKDIHIDLDTVVYRIITCFGLYKEALPYNLEYSKEEILSWLIKNDYKGRLSELISQENIGSASSVKSSVSRAIQEVLTKNSKKVFGDKAPEIENFIPELLLLIPHAKIIHIVRDGRAVAASKYKRAHTNLSLGAQQWLESNILALSNQALIGEENYKIVKYEDLIRYPEKELKEICTFLEVEYDPQMTVEVEGQKTDELYVKSSIDASKIDSFKKELSKSQIKKIERIQAPLLKRFAYDLEFPIKETKYRQMSVLKRLFFSQEDNVRQLLVGKRMGMKSGKNVMVNIPLKTRLKTFVFMLGYDLIPKRNFKRIFSKRWMKERYLSDESEKTNLID
ncbi:MAG: sulfotransferase [Flavobacteriales bacterium]|nr:sulfotransferase [Flavobacteriales bacterium]